MIAASTASIPREGIAPVRAVPRFDERRVYRLALGLALLPLVVSAVALVFAVGSSYRPVADLAYTEMHTRDVGRHAVLVGLFSRRDWSHPGPMLFYLLALPYRLAGGASIGIHLGALLINGAAVTAMAAIARRLGGTVLALLMITGSAALMHSLGPDFVQSPWNPLVTVLPYAVLVLLTWAMTCGQAWALPAGAIVVSFLVQTHVGYVVLAIPLFVWGVAWLVVAVAGRRQGWHDLVRAGVIAAAVTIVLWLPPIVDQLTHSPGNLRKIVHYFRHPDSAAHTLREGIRIVGGEFALAPQWLTGPRPLGGVSLAQHPYAYKGPVPVLLIPFLGAGLVLWRRRDSIALRFVASLVLALALGVFSVVHTIGVLSDYRLRWTWVLGMLGGVAIAWTVCLVLGQRARWLPGLAIGVLVVLAGVNSVNAATVGTPHGRWSKTLAVINPRVEAALPARGGAVIVVHTSLDALYYAPGVVLGLERKGVDARVMPEPATRIGRHRVYRGGPVRAVLMIASGKGTLTMPPGSRLVAYWGTPRATIVRLQKRQAVLNAAHARGELDDAQLFTRLHALPPIDALAVFMTVP